MNLRLKLPSFGLLALLALCLVLPPPVHAGADTEIKTFADSKGMVSQDNFILYLIFRLDIPPSKVATPQGFDLKKAAKESRIAFWLAKMELLNGSGPYTADQINQFPPIQEGRTAQQLADARKPWRKIPAVTEPYVDKTVEYVSVPPTPPIDNQHFSGLASKVDIDQEKFAETHPPDKYLAVDRRVLTLGPFLLRREVAPIAENMWALESIKDAADMASIKGAKITYSNDFLTDGNGAWDTEGALIWPIHLVETQTSTDAWSVHMGPAVYWKVQEKEKSGETDVNELRFSVPFAAAWQNGIGDPGPGDTTPEQLATLRQASEVFLLAEPFYQTDTDFEGEIFGVTGSVEFRNQYLGHYRHLCGTTASSLDYRLRLTGLVDYSSVEQGSRYISRAEGSDWFRLGGEVALDVGLFNNNDSSKQPIIATVSYRGMETVSGEGDFADLFKANITYWVSPYVGITADYQRGETPVAAKDIDLMTIGLEIKL